MRLYPVSYYKKAMLRDNVVLLSNDKFEAQFGGLNVSSNRGILDCSFPVYIKNNPLVQKYLNDTVNLSIADILNLSVKCFLSCFLIMPVDIWNSRLRSKKWRSILAEEFPFFLNHSMDYVVIPWTFTKLPVNYLFELTDDRSLTIFDLK